MRTNRKAFIILLTTSIAVLAWKVSAQTVDDELQVARSALKADRKATVAETMQFSEQEAQAFWPLYEEYRAKMDKSADALVKLIKEYAQLYPDVPDDRAEVMLKDLGRLQEERVETRNSYLKKMGKILSPAKTLRFAQLESRLDLALQLEMASKIPLVPIEGRLTGESASAVAVAEGVPGASAVETHQLTATVTAIDKATRKVTLLGRDGIKQTVTVGPAAINFDQIHVGDQLKVTVTESLVVYVAGEGETPTDGAVGMVGLAPKGAKPGGIMAATTQVTAKITAIDLEHRKATLQFEDGTTRTVAVRPDVDLGKRKVGETVVIRATEELAIRVEKP
jgi:Cu/Ag efflux protein CusF